MKVTQHEKYFHNFGAYKFPTKVLINLGYCWIENFNVLNGKFLGENSEIFKDFAMIRFNDVEAFQTIDWISRSPYSRAKLLQFKREKPEEYSQLRRDLVYWMFYRHPVLKMYDALHYILSLEKALKSTTWIGDSKSDYHISGNTLF